MEASVTKASHNVSGARRLAAPMPRQGPLAQVSAGMGPQLKRNGRALPTAGKRCTRTRHAQLQENERHKREGISMTSRRHGVESMSLNYQETSLAARSGIEGGDVDCRTSDANRSVETQENACIFVMFPHTQHSDAPTRRSMSGQRRTVTANKRRSTLNEIARRGTRATLAKSGECDWNTIS